MNVRGNNTCNVSVMGYSRAKRKITGNLENRTARIRSEYYAECAANPIDRLTLPGHDADGAACAFGMAVGPSI